MPDCNVTIRTAPLFLFAVQGEIQRFSDLKVISLIILNKLDVRPPPMTGCVSILPWSLLSAQLGGLVHSENRISCFQPEEKKKYIFSVMLSFCSY